MRASKDDLAREPVLGQILDSDDFEVREAADHEDDDSWVGRLLSPIIIPPILDQPGPLLPTPDRPLSRPFSKEGDPI